MSDLVDFLLARIAEDEREAREGLAAARPTDLGRAYRYAMSLLLSRCERSRRIIASLRDDAERNLVGDFHERDHAPLVAEHVLQLLALAYTHHPDFREEWRP